MARRRARTQSGGGTERGTRSRSPLHDPKYVGQNLHCMISGMRGTHAGPPAPQCPHRGFGLTARTARPSGVHASPTWPRAALIRSELNCPVHDRGRGSSFGHSVYEKTPTDIRGGGLCLWAGPPRPNTTGSRTACVWRSGGGTPAPFMTALYGSHAAEQAPFRVTALVGARREMWRRCGVANRKGPPADHDWGAETGFHLLLTSVGADGFEPPTSAL